MTFEMTLILIALGSTIALFGLFFLGIYFSAKRSEKELKEDLEYMARVNEMLREKAQREGGRRITNWEEYSYLKDLWND